MRESLSMAQGNRLFRNNAGSHPRNNIIMTRLQRGGMCRLPFLAGDDALIEQGFGNNRSQF